MRLLDGVNRRYIANNLDDSHRSSSDQLFDDLKRMNIVPRLEDGTMPLLQWLINAERRFRELPQKKVFEDARIKVSRTGETTTIDVSAYEFPSAEYEEVITDGVDDFQSVSFLSIGAKRLDAVAKILTPRLENGKLIKLPDDSGPIYSAGTGWLIAGDLLMTNYHVIRNRPQDARMPSDEDILRQALESQAQFF